MWVASILDKVIQMTCVYVSLAVPVHCVDEIVKHRRLLINQELLAKSDYHTC